MKRWSKPRSQTENKTCLPKKERKHGGWKDNPKKTWQWLTEETWQRLTGKENQREMTKKTCQDVTKKVCKRRRRVLGDSPQEGESQEEQVKFNQRIQEGVLELNLWLNLQREDGIKWREEVEARKLATQEKKNEEVTKESLRKTTKCSRGKAIKKKTWCARNWWKKKKHPT